MFVANYSYKKKMTLQIFEPPMEPLYTLLYTYQSPLNLAFFSFISTALLQVKRRLLIFKMKQLTNSYLCELVPVIRVTTYVQPPGKVCSYDRAIDNRYLSNRQTYGLDHEEMRNLSNKSNVILISKNRKGYIHGLFITTFTTKQSARLSVPCSFRSHSPSCTPAQTRSNMSGNRTWPA